MSIHPIDDEGEDLAGRAANVAPPQQAAEGFDEDREAREWLANVYQGDRVRQLSLRSIVTGMLIGGVMSISNLYVGLKTGWGLGVTITACIIAYAVFRALVTVIPWFRNDPFTILENNTMSSAASAAGYMASAGLVSAIPALQLLTGETLSGWQMFWWLAGVSVLGVFMAVPLKRQMINIDKLPFPSGIATAETLRSMHSAGAEAMQKAKALLYAAIGGALMAVWRDGFPPLAAWLGKRNESAGKLLESAAFPAELPLYPNVLSRWLPDLPTGEALMRRLTLGFEGSLIMIAAGAIMGIRVGISLLLGAVFYYGLLAPRLIENGWATAGYRGIVAWTLWPATAMMVTSGLLAFALRWRTVVRSFSGLTSFASGRRAQNDPLASVEVPGLWFMGGVVVSGASCVLMGHLWFHINWWMGITAVLLTFVLSIVAARATGETDVTPIGAMGKITQLAYGAAAKAVAMPNPLATNLMTASITAGAASHAADLLTDLKCGYLLGGNPRKQTIAQLFGVMAGAFFSVPVYAVIAKPEKLGSPELPAPAARVWASVAEMMAKGTENLPRCALQAMVIGGAVGIVITLAEEFLPKRYAKFIPSATGLGIAGVVPAFNSISMFLGALGAWLLLKSSARIAEKYTIAAASGLIAGESLTGVAIILCLQGPQLIQEMLRLSG